MGVEVKERLASIREAMKGNEQILKFLEDYEDTFLFEGFKEYFTSLLPLDSEIVLAHHDAQENNILSSLEDNTKIILIDLEYVGWAPKAMDIANYLNETMLDNAYALKNGIACYLRNFANQRE